MSPINTTNTYLLTAILGVLMIAHISPLYHIGHILLGIGAFPALWNMIKADWAWIKDHAEIKFWR